MIDGMKCATCERADVRLYRSYGSSLREEEIVCNEHLKSTAWQVPCVTAPDGSVGGYTSSPDSDIDRWYALPDADTSAAAPRWDRRDGEPEGWRVERPATCEQEPPP